jgi:hypothetical protein
MLSCNSASQVPSSTVSHCWPTDTDTLRAKYPAAQCHIPDQLILIHYEPSTQQHSVTFLTNWYWYTMSQVPSSTVSHSWWTNTQHFQYLCMKCGKHQQHVRFYASFEHGRQECKYRWSRVSELRNHRIYFHGTTYDRYAIVDAEAFLSGRNLHRSKYQNAVTVLNVGIWLYKTQFRKINLVTKTMIVAMVITVTNCRFLWHVHIHIL